MSSNNKIGAGDSPAELYFAGWGNVQKVTDLHASVATEIEYLDQEKKHFLDEKKATAICGNDITSSCLYVSALAIAMSGIYAPVALLLVSLTLYLFRKIYAEVGSALPLNGGTFTLLLNTTSKKVAAVAACLTILSYIATAVISANEAIHYMNTIFHALPVNIGTIMLLGAFAVLTIMGVSESANVALGIFIIHLVTLGLLILASTWTALSSPSELVVNVKSAIVDSPWYIQIMKGYFVALLGISGFESSANYIEEQKKGVFPKTLKNMWWAVTILNPAICLLALCLFPLPFIIENKSGLLALMGTASLGKWFGAWIAINAFLVLSGAVLTSFVGITGLARRMALDRCLPQFLLKENRSRKTNHWIILGFLFICISVLIITGGVIESLAGVYTLSFLSVMFLFAVGNALLKVQRSRLPREERAPWWSVIVAAGLVLIGLVGNIYSGKGGAGIFFGYYAVTVGVVMFLLLRTALLKFLLQAIYFSIGDIPVAESFRLKTIKSWIEKLGSLPVVYFTKGDNLSTLHRAIRYVLDNEQTRTVKVVHVYSNEEDVPKILWQNTKVIDEIYPELRVDFILVQGEFTPSLVQKLSERLGVPKNRMFIGTPSARFPHRIEALGGVRVII